MEGDERQSTWSEAVTDRFPNVQCRVPFCGCYSLLVCIIWKRVDPTGVVPRRARLQTETALSSHIRVVVIAGDPQPGTSPLQARTPPTHNITWSNDQCDIPVTCHSSRWRPPRFSHLGFLFDPCPTAHFFQQAVLSRVLPTRTFPALSHCRASLDIDVRTADGIVCWTVLPPPTLDKRFHPLSYFAGKRRYDRKQSGYGGQTKPIFHKKVRKPSRL